MSFITLVAVLGVMLGVCALVVAMAVMNGYQVNLIRAMAGALPHVTLHPLGKNMVPTAESVSKALEPEFPVRSTSRLTLREVLVQGPGETGGRALASMVRGIELGEEARQPDFLIFINDGSEEWKSAPEPVRRARASDMMLRLSKMETEGVYPIILGRMLAEKLGAVPGQELTPMKFPGPHEGFSPQPLPTRFLLIGYLETGIVVLDELVGLMDLDLLPQVFPAHDRPLSLGIRLSHPLQAGEAANRLRFALDEEGRSFYIYSWLENNKGLFQVIKAQKAMLFMVLLLIVIIAFFGMVSALVMLVAEKTREITILKSIGVRDRSIYRIFLFQGLFIGVLGAVLGMGLGLGVCWVLDAFPVFEIPAGVYPGSDRVPVQVAPFDLLWVGLATMVTCLVATVFPARKAMAIQPASGLRTA